ncbi:VOC family protein [Tessaracoccus aquimaris]|uniref:VOC family protein n=1 Tax=Tessaracoccus aquimaris TaxID=1332264 RepID=A0A1Q2CRX7_9ACTN|nr:VOC family protein [Tessaracoccus aquimaris]AQP48864.1 VOC family protein [Tessaracoccus aquimaris]
MTAPQPYVTFPGNAREALTFYASVFGGRAEMYTLAEFNRTDGPPEAIAHGEVDGPVRIGGSDAAPGQPGVSMHGLMLALLGTAEPEVLHRWFDALADGGTVVDPLGPKPWGASDGQVIDRFGLHWLIGYEGQQ